jgi:hypothetical protein
VASPPRLVPLVLAIAASGAALFAPHALAASVEGYVVELQEPDLVVDVASADGASDGDIVELWRPLKLRHPVTGRTISDRFLIGRLRLGQVRQELALARPDGKLDRLPRVGDVVVLKKAAPRDDSPPPSAVAKAPAARDKAAAGPEPKVVPVEDAEARAVSELFDNLRGASVPRRIVAYEDYVRKHPNSRYAVVLYEEAVQLRRLLAFDKRGAVATPPQAVSFAPPSEAVSHAPFQVGVELDDQATGAVLHSRRAGEVAYVSTPMTASGRGYFLARLPGERMQAPQLEYFIEATNERGEAFPVVATAPEPNRLPIHDAPQPAGPPPHETVASAWTDYADWNRLRGNDRIWQTEGYFGVRLQDVGVRAVRTGFGVYRGVGGSLQELDELNLAGRKVGLTYGYLEGEFGFTPLASLIVRPILGLRDDGVTGGAQALVRIGNDKKTNLSIGGEILGGIGLRGITELQLDVFERIPILLRTEVTNQPAGAASEREAEPPFVPPEEREESLGTAEIGARAIGQVGYEMIDGFVVAIRGSYQGRTIRHAGPGLGGAVSYTW